MMSFRQYLEALSRLNGFRTDKTIGWYFHPGMLAMTWAKWWGDFKRRATAHEGIDVTYFSADSGQTLNQFTPDTLVPAWHHSHVVCICNDFLGKSIITQPLSLPTPPGVRGLLVYAHVIPLDHIRPGRFLERNEPIAKVSHTLKNKELPPHLHLSFILAAEDINEKDLNWTYFCSSEDIVFLNPWFL